MCRSKVLCAMLFAGAASAAFAGQREAVVDGPNAVSYRSSLSSVALGGAASTSDVYWDNGAAASPAFGHSSEHDTAVSSSDAYDDFCVDACHCLKVDTVAAEFLSNSTYGLWAGATAVAYIYSDCDGCPDELIASSFDPEIEGANSTPDQKGFRMITYTFEYWILENGKDQILDEFVLDGGCYWLSVVHIGDGSWVDRGFWKVTEGPDIKAGEAKVESVDFWIPPCTPISDTNTGKRDFVFRVYGDAADVICDNGNCARQGSPSALSTSLPSSRTADQFFVREDTVLEIITVCLINNCDPNRSFVEVWEGDCYPEVLLASYNDPIVVDTKMTSLAGNGFQGGDPIWELTWCIDGGLLLEGCRTYWVAPVGKGTGTFGERAFFAFNADCKDPDCLIKIAEGRFLRHPNPNWEKVSLLVGEPRDFAFKVAGSLADLGADDPDPTPDPTPNDKVKSLDLLRAAIGSFGSPAPNGEEEL